MAQGGCRCGAVRYEADGAMEHHALCHCRDCQLAHGAPLVGWIAFKSGQVRFSGQKPVAYTSPQGSTRSFCGTCGTPVAFVNEEALPGIVDLPSVTLDDPDAFAPQAQIQMAERRAWMDGVAELPAFERFPS